MTTATAHLLDSFLSEATDTIERLSEVLRDTPAPVDVLFREFHTLKGNANALSFSHMASLSHKTETLLSQFRTNKTSLTTSAEELVHQAVSELKGQLVAIAESGQDKPVSEALSQQLTAFDKAEVAEEKRQETPFSSLLQKHLTGLVMALSPKAKTVLLQQPIQAMIKEAQAERLKGLEKSLTKLTDALFQEDKTIFTLGLADLFQKLMALSQQQALSLDISKTYSLAQSLLKKSYTSLLAELYELDPAEAKIKALQANLKHLAAMALLQGYESHRSTWLYLLSWVNKGEREDRQADWQALLASIETSEDSHASLDQFKARATAALVTNEQLALVAKHLGIHDADLANCPADTIQKLLDALHAKKQLFEVRLYANDGPSSEAFIGALPSLAELAYSYTTFLEKKEQTAISFILISDKAKAEFIEALPDVAFLSPVKETATEIDAAAQLAKETRLSLNQLKVKGEQIDALMNQLSEVLDSSNGLGLLLQKNKVSIALLEKHRALKDQLNVLQKSVLDLRIVPVTSLFKRLEDLAYATSKTLSKPLTVELKGSETLIDKAYVDALAEPLGHLIRNAVDHGLEDSVQRQTLGKDSNGKLIILAESNASHVLITVKDDGQGLKTARIKEKAIEQGLIDQDEDSETTIHACIFEPALSTTDKVSNTSGRGVGMDVVLTKVRDAGGEIHLSSEQGKGLSVTISLPLSSMLQPVILVENHEQSLAIHEKSVREIVGVNAFDLDFLAGYPTMAYRGQDLPVFYLNQLLDSSHLQISEQDNLDVLVIGSQHSEIGLVVDKVVGLTDLLLREQHPFIQSLAGISNAAVLGDGQMVYLLDMDYLVVKALDKNKNIQEGWL